MIAWMLFLVASAFSTASAGTADIQEVADVIRHERPQIAERVDQMEPIKNRAGQWFFPGADLTDPAAQVLIQDRLLKAVDAPAVRVALAYALDEHHRLPWDVIRTQEPELRMAMLHAYKNVASEAAVDVLASAMKDEAKMVRAEAVRLAGYLPQLGSLSQSVVTGLQDEDPSVRMMSVRALGWHEVSEAFTPVVGMLSDPDTQVRLAAIRALGKIDRERATGLTEIQRFAVGDDPALRRAVERLARP